MRYLGQIQSVQQIQTHGADDMNTLCRSIIVVCTYTLVCSIPLSAATRTGGVISRNTRWTAEKSPYIVTRDILIERHARLTIAPGTRILISKPVRYEKEIYQLEQQFNQNIKNIASV